MNRTGETRMVVAILLLLLASILLLASASQAQTCSGNACSAVSLKLLENCVWAENSGAKAATLTVRVGSETLVLPLEGADLGKAEAASRGPSTQQAAQERQCQSVLRSSKMLDDMRARGSKVPFNPEIDGRAGFCRKLMADKASQAAAPAAAQGGLHVSVYDAVSGRDRALFRAKLRPASGCVARLTDIASYSADEGAAPQRPADR